MQLSVFTVCMPDYTPDKAAARLSRWGADGVEWRIQTPPVPGTPVNYWQGNYASYDPKTLVEEAPNIREICRKHKLAMPVLASYLGYKDTDLIERVFEAGSVLGAKGVRVGVDSYDGKARYDKVLAKTVKGWETVVRLGEKYKIKPLAEIHMGRVIPSASTARRFAENFAPAQIGIIYDPGNLVYEGYEPWKMGIEILGRYLEHVHVKNASWSIQDCDRDGNLRWAPAADTLLRGRVNWAEVVDALRATGYRGWLSLEDFGPGQTDAKIKDDLRYLRKLVKTKSKKK